jgi:GH25 family lysozyme M1 (1,4-beta-N-acetylmuramidase)
MEEYMKRNILIGIIAICIILIFIISIFFYKKIQEENKRIDAESITLKEDLNIEFGEKVNVSDFIDNINGSLIEDYEIDTESLGKKEITFNFLNIKNKLKTATFCINVVDTISPRIFSGSSYTVKVGTNKDLTQVLISGDNIDDTPLREIIGDYDFNTVGDYNLIYKVTDSSGNETQKDFTLHVVENIEESVASQKEPKYWEDIIKNYKNDSTKLGIDVSKWQGEIDWEKVKNAGVEFTIIRLGYQTDYDGECKIDPYFETNMQGAKNAGIPIGLYFYSYAKTLEQAEEQANWVKEKIGEYEISLPIAFDWESWSSFNKTNMSFYKINKVANRFLEILEQNGYKGMLYSSKNYLENIWTPEKYPTWLAHYTSNTDYKGEYYIWQMCDTGRINGINGNVDIDIMVQ